MNLYKHRLASQGSYTYASYVYIVYRHANNNTFALMQNMKKEKQNLWEFPSPAVKGCGYQMGPIKIYCLTLVVQRWIQRLCSTTKGTRERRWRDVLGRHSKPRGGWGAFYPSHSNRHSLIFPFNISNPLSWGICQDNVRNAAMFLNQLPYYWKPGDLSAKDLQLLLKRCSNDLFLTKRCYLCAAHISFSPESGYLKFFFFLGYLKCTKPPVVTSTAISILSATRIQSALEQCLERIFIP